ncbi:MAG: dual specificity protein phosphatase family protein [Ignavibacteriales bacterium]|nr:MAG: dual specificity protein phosphatase family protein [Ignavibacteriales bacterium]
MSHLKIIISILLITFINPGFAQNEVPVPQKLEWEGFRNVIAQTGNLFISGQPDENAFRKLKDEGVTTIINLRTEQEMANRDYVPFDEKQLLDELGLKYVHIPLGGNDTPYNREALTKFTEEYEKADGKVLLHCTVAWRASHMWAAYLIEYKKYSPAKAIEYAKMINFGELPLEGLLGRKLILE